MSNAQLQSNLANYQTTAGLSANVATLTANNASFLGGTAAASYVQNTDSRTLSGNLVFSGANISFTGAAARFSGNVGIGSESSANSRVYIQPSSTPSNSYTTPQLAIGSAIPLAGNNQLRVTYGSDGGVWFSSLQSLESGNGARLLLNPIGGGVGIGTVSPVNSFGYGSLTINGNNNGAILSFQTAASENFRIQHDINLYTNINNKSNVALTFSTNDTERMRISATGNVGIGNIAPNATLAVSGTANISGNVVIGGISTFSANVVLGSVGLSANGGFGTAGQVLHSNGSATYWAADDNSGGTVTSVATGNGMTGGAITTTGTVSVLANNGITANSTGTFAAQANGISVTAAGINVLGGPTLTVNTTGAHVNSTLSINTLTTTGNVTIAGNLVVSGGVTVATGNVVTFTDNMLYLNQGVFANITNITSNGTHVIFTANNNYSAGWDVYVSNVNPTSYNGTYTNIFAANATTFTVANTNTASYVTGGTARGKTDINPDIGIAAGYNDGTYHHTGIFRDASDGYWKVFDGYDPEPDDSIFIDTTNTSFNIANFWTNTVRLGNTSVYATINSSSYSGGANSATYANSSVTNTFTVGTAAYFVANGNFGVGTAFPSHKFVVANNGNSATVSQLFNANTGSGASVIQQFIVSDRYVNQFTGYASQYFQTVGVGITTSYNDFDTQWFRNNAGTVRMVINSSGAVGIGTSSPSSKFTVATNTQYSGITLSNGSTNSVEIIGTNATTNDGGLIQALNGGVVTTRISGTPDFNSYFNASNLGVGTSSPGYKLHIQRSSGETVGGEIYATEGSYWYQLNSRSGAGAYNPLVQAGDHSFIYADGSSNTGALVIGQWSSQARGIRIDAGGNVGISNSSPNARLAVTGTANISGNVVIGGITTFSGNVVLGSVAVSANGGVGTAGQVLTSNGSATYWATAAAGVNTAAQFTWTNTHTFNSNTTFGNSTFANTTVTSFSGYSNPQALTSGVLQTNASLNTLIVGPYTVSSGNSLIVATGSRLVIV